MFFGNVSFELERWDFRRTLLKIGLTRTKRKTHRFSSDREEEEEEGTTMKGTDLPFFELNLP